MERAPEPLLIVFANAKILIRKQFSTPLSLVVVTFYCYTTLEAISRASGLKRSALKRYANCDVSPREAQREKIVAALKKISADLMALADSMK